MKNLLLILLVIFASSALADDEYLIVIKNHRFEPAELTIPAGKKVKVRIENKDASPEEFESHELNREKVIAGNSTANIYIGPLSPDATPFFGEFNEATAKGVVIAK